MSSSTTSSSSSSSLGLSDPEKPRQKASVHHDNHRRRGGSGELDVFEATGYYNSTAFPTEKIHRGQKEQPPPPEQQRQQQQSWRRERRISLDAPTKEPPIPEIPKEDKKQHHPTSPAGRLASFLNSLFNQAALNKKKKPSSSSKSAKDCTEGAISAGGGDHWRKRRSSIGHSQSSAAAADADSSSVHGFGTPPPLGSDSSTATSYCYSNSGDIRAQSKPQNKARIQVQSCADPQIDRTQHKQNSEFSWMDENLKLGGIKNGVWTQKGTQKKNLSNWKKKSEEKEFRGFRDRESDDNDDGVDTDSSSDLFELENYDLGFYSSGGALPVYETTRIRGAPPTASISPL